MLFAKAPGIALIDTVIWSRAPLHADKLLTRLRAGDLDVARSIGIPDVYLSGPPSVADPMVQAVVQPLLERAGLVAAIDEAWALIAALALVGVLTDTGDQTDVRFRRCGSGVSPAEAVVLATKMTSPR
jgi:hypothetical protein